MSPGRSYNGGNGAETSPHRSSRMTKHRDRESCALEAAGCIGAPLCGSHIIPEFMWRPLYGPGHKMIGLKVRDGESHAELVQKGLREPLLCAACEGFLNRHYERPNAEIWRAIVSGGERPRKGVVVKPLTVKGSAQSRGFVLLGLDYPSFKPLLLSVLWRCSVSTLPEYSDVSLGPYEGEIHQKIVTRNPGPVDRFPSLLFFDPSCGYQAGPQRFRTEGSTAYKFILPYIWWVIRVSPGPKRMSRAALQEDGRLPVIKLRSGDTLRQLVQVRDFVRSARYPTNVDHYLSKATLSSRARASLLRAGEHAQRAEG